MEWLTPEVLNFILGLAAVLLGWRFAAAKKALKEISELCVIADAALEDDKITDKEAADIIREAQEAMAAIKALIKKSSIRR